MLSVPRTHGIVLSVTALACALIAGSCARSDIDDATPQVTGAVGVEVVRTDRPPTGYEVTFRLDAPDASAVGLVGDVYFTDPDNVTRTLSHDARLGDEWRQGDVSHPLVAQPPARLLRGDDGVWEITTAMPAGTYSYGFVEGECDRAALCVGHPDPSNPPPFLDVPGAGRQRTSQVFVPMHPDFPTYDVAFEATVPVDSRGEVMHRTYPSAVSVDPPGEHSLGVYLPAGCDASRAAPYPLLVLSHGMGENETGWFADGRAAQILDHAIAAGQIPPVVMVTTDFNGLVSGPAGAGEFQPAYVDELVGSVLPYVEQEFHVARDPAARAFGGLSMGGALAVGLLERHPGLFGWYGIWSAAPLPGGWGPRTAKEREAVRSALGIHVGAGLQDDLARIGASSRARADDYRMIGASVEEANVPGAHTWQVWRAELRSFLASTAFSGCDVDCAGT